MNIVYATSDLYSSLALISLKSVFMNNADMDEIHVFYIENGLSSHNKSLLLDLVREYNRSIDFISMPQEYMVISGVIRNNPVVYSYCFLQDLLPINIDKVLLLEADEIVVGSLKEYEQIDLGDNYLAAVDDMQSKWIKKRLGMAPEKPYVNCGLALYNLKKMREEHFTEKIKKVIQEGKVKFYQEVQDEINYVAQGRIKLLPQRFNSTTILYAFEYEDMLRYRMPSTFCSKEEFIEGRNNPIVVHFAKSTVYPSRPWMEGCIHPYTGYYREVKNQTVMAEMPLWPMKTGILSKMAYTLYRINPTLAAVVLGVPHSYFYPLFLYKFF